MTTGGIYTCGGREDSGLGHRRNRALMQPEQRPQPMPWEGYSELFQVEVRRLGLCTPSFTSHV